ncbi:ABC transporter permease [Weissella confusa]|uniref:ABC transporter permease n=1 Tax=Weissella confusa TaxID=1583 RepID=UPI00107F4CFA|nr:ABC transporter permease [Weissella confusa]MBD5833674.1 teichoic acid translocation permease [Weissella confusa]TGE64818.1 teichoic acid translocation permease [Weissella confusa]
MKSLIQVLKEIWTNLPIIRRIAAFNVQSRFADNYLGSIWDYLEPLLYIATYFIVFGLGLYNGTVNGTPYIVWLLVGIVPWYFIQGSFNKGLTSISSQLRLLTKTKFPVSVAPVMPMLQELRRFLVMAGLTIVVVLSFGRVPSLTWIGLLYSFVAMFATVLAHNLINSTLAVMIPDYKQAMNALFRVLFFTSGVIINLDQRGLPFVLVKVIKMFPFYYVIESFRDALLYNVWFFENSSNVVFFWLLTFFMLLVGSIVHLRFRERFIDML